MGLLGKVSVDEQTQRWATGELSRFERIAGMLCDSMDRLTEAIKSKKLTLQ